MEKDVFSMGHFSTFIYSVLHYYIVMFSTWLHVQYFPSFKHNVMWIGSKVTVALIEVYNKINCLERSQLLDNPK